MILTIVIYYHSCFNDANFGIINSIVSVRTYTEVKKMTRISEEQVKHVAHLARLAITEDEAKKFTTQLDAIIGFAEQLNELDTSNVEATSHVLDMKNVMREDKPVEGLPREEVLKNAPDKHDGQVRVPSILA
jgi:aspartyl-tRNA(Asn)/glutamyl-tRNA(Gln) amidotransferase subunit C